MIGFEYFVMLNVTCCIIGPLKVIWLISICSIYSLDVDE